MNIEWVTSIAVIAADPAKSRRLYVDALGLPLEPDQGGDYFHSDQVGGTKHFGVWPLADAARACFGTVEWPADLPVPQVSIEFEVENVDAVAAAADELRDQGFQVPHDAREEPWGQTVARLISNEGSIVGISYAPSQHTA